SPGVNSGKYGALLYDVASPAPKVRQQFETVDQPFAYAPDGKSLAYSDYKGLCVLDLTAAAPVKSLRYPLNGWRTLGFAADGKFLATASPETGVISFVDAENPGSGEIEGSELRLLRPSNAWLPPSTAFTPNGKTLVYLASLGRLVLWDWTARRKL